LGFLQAVRIVHSKALAATVSTNLNRAMNAGISA
jgi:hypothetical protein